MNPNKKSERSFYFLNSQRLIERTNFVQAQ